MPIIDMAATGRKIHDLRVAAGMTIRDIQDACGVSATAVTKWQKGCAVPTIDNRARQAFNEMGGDIPKLQDLNEEYKRTV